MEFMGPFAYVMCLAAYFLGACFVWLAALVLAINPRWRPLAKRLAAAMFFSFPGVFLCQLLAAPGLLVLLVGGGWLSGLIPQANPMGVLLVMSVVYGVVGVAFFASVLGFVVGWWAGWRLASGQPLGAFIRTNRFIAPVTRIVVRRFPFLARFLPQAPA